MRDYAPRTTPTFMAGAFMVANAIEDCLLIYRGSSCIAEHVTQVFQWHDLAHDVAPNREGSRLILTMDPDTVSSMGTQESVRRVAFTGLESRDVSVFLLSELSRHTLMGEAIKLSADRLAEEVRRPCVPATARTLDRDFSHAFTSLMSGLAEAVVAGGPMPRREGNVALIGYMRARNEADAEGDTAELRRMVEALGLEVGSIWLSGGTFAELGAAREAELLVGLPFGEEAANTLAGRSGVEVLPADLPVSIRDTVRWVERLAGAVGRPEAARAFISAELGRIVPLIDRYATRYLQGKRVLVAATGDWLPGLVRCLEEDLGMEVVSAIMRHRHPWRDRPSPEEGGMPEDPDRAFDPSVASLQHQLARAREQGGVDLIIGSAWERNALADKLGETPFLEFGYPQLHAHFIAPTPHLGFHGVLTWAQRIFEALERGV